mgnify:CR=1 FL=1
MSLEELKNGYNDGLIFKIQLNLDTSNSMIDSAKKLLSNSCLPHDEKITILNMLSDAQESL